VGWGPCYLAAGRVAGKTIYTPRTRAPGSTAASAAGPDRHHRLAEITDYRERAARGRAHRGRPRTRLDPGRPVARCRTVDLTPAPHTRDARFGRQRPSWARESGRGVSRCRCPASPARGHGPPGGTARGSRCEGPGVRGAGHGPPVRACVRAPDRRRAGLPRRCAVGPPVTRHRGSGNDQ
jgi:hypothetical protein